MRHLKVMGIFSAGLLCGLAFHWMPTPSASAYGDRAGNGGGGISGGSCPADIAPAPAGDGIVNVDDLLAVINAWGACPATDIDGDGWTIREGDCDDTNPDLYPGVPEVCNNIDDDCDGQIDEGLSGGSEPNNSCVQAFNIGSIAGDICPAQSLFTAGNLVPAGDVDFFRFTGFEGVGPGGSNDLYATVTLTVPAGATSPLQLCVWCESCAFTPVCTNVMPGQSDSVIVLWHDEFGQTDREMVFEVKQNAPATGECLLYEVAVTCGPGLPNLVCD